MNIKVLVVDDDEDLLFLADKFLKKANKDFELVSARTDQEALQALEEGLFDAVVCDHYLGPESMTGLDLLEWVRNAGRAVPFIIFTGRSEESVAIRALNMGADYYLKKETDEFRELFNQLAEKIRSAVEERRHEEEVERSHNELERRVLERTKELQAAKSRLEEEVEERRRVEDALLIQRDLGNALCKAASTSEALQYTKNAVLQLDGIDSVAISVRTRGNGDSHSSITHMIPNEILELAIQIISDKGDSAIFTQSEIHELTGKAQDSNGLLAVVFVHIRDDQGPGGVIAAGSHSQTKIPLRDVYVLEAIAIQVGAYLTRDHSTRAVIDSQQELIGVFDSLHDALFITDTDWRILETNVAAQKLVGRQAAELTGMDVLTMYNLDSDNFVEQAVQRLKKGGVFELDTRLRSKSGSLMATRSRVVKGRHGGEEVFFFVSRPNT